MPPLQKRDANSNCTPPPDVRAGQKKNLHSPWSAPRTRKRANVTAKAEPAPLAIIEEDYSSPPKRRNGEAARRSAPPSAVQRDDLGVISAAEGTSPAARELRLSAAGLALDVAALDEAGPLAQGLLRQPSGDGFSPLGSGFVRSFASGISITAVAGGPPLQQGLSDAQQDAAAGAAGAPAGLGGSEAQPGNGPASSESSPVAVPLAECSYGMLERCWTAPVMPAGALVGLSCGVPEHPRPMSAQTALTDRSRRSHGEMECDVRSSWGSDRSADVQSWRNMQARLHEEFALVQPARRSGRGGSIAREACGQQDAMRASAESLRDSLELPSPPERQASIVPLRTSIKGHWQQSHLPSSSPATEARTQHKLPSTSVQSPAFQRLFGSGQKHKGTSGCFCPSPFCKPPREAEEDAEVVRRTDSEEFVLHRTQSFNAGSRERPGAKPRRESLNRPPSPGEQELVHRQDAFSAKCSSPPVHLLSHYTDDDSPCYSPDGQIASGEDLLVCLRDQSKNPTIDELNDMLRSFCTLDLHPKDAEELVSEACKSCELAPNATTLRTLDKIWAAHEQMYG